ncbi:ceroid-lipofuscinosis neuronal protein 6 homolog [Tubulanus polymorphus]|uniref:ceroid-lipofuscinosis neuronal protein 6 homolog n=1 Tax=Tubulanus polymorphus TaxID=672921 RepID=UPI003DA337C6
MTIDRDRMYEKGIDENPNSLAIREKEILQKFTKDIKKIQVPPLQFMAAFQWKLWLALMIENWVLDFGRPIAMSYVPLSWSPLNLPNVGDFFHMAYNIFTAFILMKLVKKSSQKLPEFMIQILIITFVMGASIHLVGDSVNHRLTHSGYQLHLSVQDNPIMKELKPKSLVNVFELLYFYDEELGHLMWYIPFFTILTLYFGSSFTSNSSPATLSAGGWSLAIGSALYYWYLVTEGQIFPLFALSLLVMTLIVLYQHHRGHQMDSNGLFLYNTFMMTLVLVSVWVAYLWDDVDLRKKYPGFIYVPEPWAFFSLYYY